jgi:hypothetical protein
MTPAERGQYLEQPPEGAPDIEAIHEVREREGEGEGEGESPI